MKNIPYQIQKQRLQLQELTDSKALFGSMVKLRDVTEVMLRLPVLCAGAFILAKGGSEKELLTLELVKHDKIDSRGWLQVANVIHKNGNIPKPFKTIIDRVCHWITSEKLIEWRHAEVAHGALKFNPDRAFVKDFGKKCKSLDKLLKQLEKDYRDISVSDDGSTVTYMGETLPVVPYIYSDSGEAYLFDTYRNGLAKGLCYALGVKRAIPSKAYVQAYMAQADRLQASGITGEVITAEMSAAIDELNEAANFEPPTYLRDWLVEGMNAGGSGIAKGTLLLEMERGMGKSAFARALDGKSTDSSYRSFKIGDTFARGYYCSRVGIRSKGDFLFGVRNSLLTDEKDQLLYSSDEKIPSLSENGTPEDFAELLNWCRDHINEKRLLLIIDGIDEIPAEHSAILKMLPSADMLKDGVYLLLTCRSKEALNDVTKDEKRLEDENRQIDAVRSYVHPDMERAFSRDEARNLETLRRYFDRKILPKDGKKNKKNDKLEAEIQTIINEPGQRRFLEVRIIGTLIKSGKLKDIAAFAKQPDLFQYYLDYLRIEEYGNAVFSRLTEMLAALACAQEELTFGELAYLLGEDDVTMQLLTFVCDMAGILRISRDYRGNHISLASDEYRTRILAAFPDTVQLHKQAVADILDCVDIQALKAQAANRDNPLPDGLLYAAAYLPNYTEQISENVRDRVCEDIGNCTEKSREPHILHRRASMGEVWSDYCGKAGWYRHQIGFLNITGCSYATLCEHEQALECRNRQVTLCRQYLAEGKLYDENFLAQAYMNRGATYQAVSRYEEALKDDGECIRIRESLHEAGMLYDLNALATAYLNRGATYCAVGKYEEALKDYGKGIAIMVSLYEASRPYDENDLAGAYMNRAVTYRAVGKYEEALKDYGECIRITESLHEAGGLYDESHLATAYMNRGVTYHAVSKYKEALKDYGECIRIMESLHEAGKLYDINYLATAYMNRGLTYADVGKYEEALKDYGECIRIRESLHEVGKLYDINYLAVAYMNRGNVYAQTGKYVESLEDNGRCIGIKEKLDRQGKLYDRNALAKAYMSQGNMYKLTGRYVEALEDDGRCIGILEELNRQGKLYDRYDLAAAYMSRGVTYHETGRYAEALEDYDRCIGIMEELDRQGKPYDRNALAKTYMNRGNTLQSTGKHDKALEDYDRCISIYEELDRQGKLYEIGDLPSAMLNKGILLITGFNDAAGALELWNQAITMLEAKKSLSYFANIVLNRLREVKATAERQPQQTPSVRTKLSAMSDEQLQELIDRIAQHIGAKKSKKNDALRKKINALHKLDRESQIEILSQLLG